MAGEQVEHVVEEADAGRRSSPRRRRGRAQADLGLLGLALDLAAVRRHLDSPIGRFVLEAASTDSACSGKPSARARCSDRRGRAPGPRPAASRPSAIRRRNDARPERPLEATGAAGRQHVVRAGRVVAEGGRRVGGRRRRSRPSSPRSRAASASSRERSRGARARSRWRASTAASVSGTCDERERRVSGDPRASAASRSTASSIASRITVSTARPRPAGRRRRARPGRRGRARSSPGRRVSPAITISSEGPAIPSIPTSPASWRFASWT